MNVAFCIGKSTGSVADRIHKNRDDVNIFNYTSVADLIKDSTSRHLYYERIAFTNKFLKHPEKDLKSLNDYIINNSEKTTVVFITKDATSQYVKIFQSIFNSPLYTVAYLGGSINVVTMVDIVTCSIVELNEKYPLSMEARVGIGGASQNVNSGQNMGVEPAKTGFSDNQPRNIEPEKPYQNVSVNCENSNSTFGTNEGSERYGNGIAGNGNGNNLETGRDSLLGFNEDVPSSVGTGENGGLNNGIGSEDSILGLGGFGKTHSDTGFLDEDELDNEGSDEDYPNPRFDTGNREVANGSKQGTTKKAESSGGSNSATIDVSDMTKVVFVVGERGTGVTTTVCNIAYDLYKNRQSVLIVDGDYKRNGLLSFIDTEDFYAKGNEDGIDTVNPYVDEEADIISNGYGSQVSKTTLSNVLRDNQIQSNYDKIIVDCPLDCINILTERSVKGNTVLLLSKSDRVSLVATSIGLTERVMIEVGVERYIMETCTVAISGSDEYLGEDIQFVKNTFFFPNGCWLDNIEM